MAADRLKLITGHLTPNPSTIIEIKDPKTFPGHLETLLKNQEYVVVIITATDLHAPEGTQTWCPYCDKARGNIKTVLIPNASSAKNGEKILYCTVQRE